MVERRRRQAVVFLEARRHGARDRIEPAALAEHLFVERHQPIAQSDVDFFVAEVAVGGAAQLVGRAVLVHEPADLARVPREIGGELGRDDQIDRAAVALAEIEQTPRRRVRQDLFLRIPLERERHAIGRDAARRSSVTSCCTSNSAPPRTRGTCVSQTRY